MRERPVRHACVTSNGRACVRFATVSQRQRETRHTRVTAKDGACERLAFADQRQGEIRHAHMAAKDRACERFAATYERDRKARHAGMLWEHRQRHRLVTTDQRNRPIRHVEVGVIWIPFTREHMRVIVEHAQHRLWQVLNTDLFHQTIERGCAHRRHSIACDLCAAKRFGPCLHQQNGNT